MFTIADIKKMWWNGHPMFRTYYKNGNFKFIGIVPEFYILNDKRPDIHTMSDVLDDACRELTRDWTESYSVWKSKLRNDVYDFVDDVYQSDTEWCNDCRMIYLAEQISNIQKIISGIEERFMADRENGTPADSRMTTYILSDPDWWRNKLQKAQNEYNFILHKKDFEQNKITPVDIDKAKEYPLEELIDIDDNDFALCINHTDRRPSMYCKDNFVHCFACQYTEDVIGVYRKLHNCSFVDAVKFLSGKK